MRSTAIWRVFAPPVIHLMWRHIKCAKKGKIYIPKYISRELWKRGRKITTFTLKFETFSYRELIVRTSHHRFCQVRVWWPWNGPYVTNGERTNVMKVSDRLAKTPCMAGVMLESGLIDCFFLSQVSCPWIILSGQTQVYTRMSFSIGCSAWNRIPI